MKSDGANLTIFTLNGENPGYCVIGCISLHYKRSVGDPMHQDGGRHEGIFEKMESGTTVIGENPRGPFAGEAHQGDHNVGVFVDETPVEVCEAKERLNVLDLTGFGPVLDGFHFLSGHGKSSRGKDVPEVLCSIRMELALLGVGI